jgi:uncharacterized protein (TIRG00374 family)
LSSSRADRPASEQHPPTAFWRSLAGSHSVRRGAILILVALALEYLVVPQIAGIRRSWHLLGRVDVTYVLLAVVLEIVSLACYAELTRAVLPRHASTFLRIWRIDLSTLAVSHVLPGGTAGGNGLAYRLFTNEGVSGADAGLALVTEGIGSALVLNAIWWVALIVSIPVSGFNPVYGSAAVLSALLLAGFAAAVLTLTRGEERATRILSNLVVKLPFLKPGAGDIASRIVHQTAVRVRTLAADRGLLRRAVFWASANWILDAASLFVFLAAFGHVENPDGLLVAYGLAYVLAAVAVTPGGLGVIEGVLVPTLVAFGSNRGVAIVAVLGYRLVNFWLPIPFGALAYLSLRVTPDRPVSSRREELTVAIAEAKALADVGRHPDQVADIGEPPLIDHSHEASSEP